MSTVFCCSSLSPWRPKKLDHEAKFATFMEWANLQTTSKGQGDCSPLVSCASYAIQLVRQVNFGPQESIRYFIPASNSFTEATEDDLINSNFEKANSYKNYKCPKHNKFFELNLYQINPTIAHHWRANLARPSREIDLSLRRDRSEVVENPTDQEGKHDLVSSDVSDKASPKANSVPSHAQQDRYDDYNDYNKYNHRDDSDNERENAEDFTACDKECGYCGSCDY